MTTEKGVGWVVQVQSEEQWISWTQWRDRERADQHVRSLLATGKYQAGRVVRVDWTIGAEVAA